MSKILILSNPNDVHAQAVEHWLKEWSSPYRHFIYRDFPQNAGISFSLDKKKSHLTISQDEYDIDLYEYSAVWYRRPKEPVPSKALTQEIYTYSFHESLSFVQGLALLMPDAFWLPSYYSNQMANHKPYQLRIAQELGFAIPKTYFGNDLEAFLKAGFTDEKLVVKSLHRGEIKQPLSILQKILLSCIRCKNWWSRNKSGENLYRNHIYAPTQKIALTSLQNNEDQFKICPH